MAKVCRLCLQKLQRGSRFFNINAVESYTGFMPYRDQLTTCIPEIALDLIPNPVICNSCRVALKQAHDFKTRCLHVEDRIREYVEKKVPENDEIDLTEIATFEEEEKSITISEIRQSPGVQLIVLPPEHKKDEPVKSEDIEDEIEISKIEKIEKVEKKKTERTRNRKQNFNIQPTREELPYICPQCNKIFDSSENLVLHKNSEHSVPANQVFLCNFCNKSFKSLQYLRKHNTVCSKEKKLDSPGSLINKRPHLPTKAKNHLKRWLFQHTDHPYPTDFEKQVLMQETNLTLLQVENWFINARRRILQDLTRLKHHRNFQISDIEEKETDTTTETMEEEEEEDSEMAGSSDIEIKCEEVR